MDSSEYELKYFFDNGFTRKQCPKCGRYFWSLGDWETCGEPPCEEYTFIGASPMKEPLGLHEMREVYLSFFESRGHKRVRRYPIVARWRDDVFFTQASIYDFQPWVINGVIDPPANPLTISQTCVRFNDIDNVGKTGRHLTFFEMCAHHAFNTKNKEVYFKDKTVELCHELFTRRMGVRPEMMRYVEAWWEGGGNSGPCLEVILQGAELATLVFMTYRDTDEGRKPLDMKVVDTGYGLERMTWVSQGATSTEEAVFGPVLKYMKDITGATVDSVMMTEYSKVAGMTNAKTATDIRKMREETASRIGISYDSLMKSVRPLEDVYVVCDHSRALAFLLNDGVVPSNVREGYFARMLVRRALRALRSLDLDIALAEIVERQIDFFSPIFPEMVENRQDIMQLVGVEEERYKETLVRGRQLVQRLTRDLKPGEGISAQKLIELYDSHGLNPEIVKEFTDAPVDIPDDFYIRVSAMHEKPEQTVTESEDLPSDLPETKTLYYEDPGVLDFKAKVVKTVGGGILLDRTAFYPEGGGQESDTGTISGRRVVKVTRSGRSIVHYVEGEIPSVGTVVEGAIDKKRRLQLMRHHTAAHIINGLARRMLGNHVWQAGAHKSENEARLDITHFENLTQDQRNQLEREVNEIVLEDFEVNTSYMARDDAERLYGFRLYQGGAVPGGTIRVVVVSGLDAEACGGLHCKRTSQVGPVRINSTKRIQDGIVRIEFSAGMPAIESMQAERNELEKSAAVLGVPYLTTASETMALFDELKEKRTILTSFISNEARTISENLLREVVEVGDVRLVRYASKAGEDPSEISKNLVANDKVVAIIATPDAGGLRLFVSRSKDVDLDCRKLLKEIAGMTGGGGGGKKEFAQGGGGDPSKLQDAFAR
ncbi:MAG: alanine--tRNA ligase, partial [Methanomassiliicoccales archaeon]|nr:alanine--tRNA ligase [Methanomassiliicoccales archaeon]